MKVRKTVSLVALFSLMLIFGTACHKKAPRVQNTEHTQAVHIVASFYPLYIMLLNITHNIPQLELSLLAPPDTGCLHDYELTTKDMRTIENCDILVLNGAGMEDFLGRALEAKKDSTIIAAQGAEENLLLLEENPHIWVSPEGALLEVQNITAGLCRLDPKNSEQYKENAASYMQKIEALQKNMHRALDSFAGFSIITFHEAFPYFAKEFGLHIVAVIEREAGTEPSARELAALVKTIQSASAAGTPIALFAEPQYSSSAAEVIAQETGFTVFELDPAVTGALSANAYLDAMEKNTTTLQQAFTSKGLDKENKM